jgi:hypothetical protein
MYNIQQTGQVSFKLCAHLQFYKAAYSCCVYYMT